VHPPHPHPRCLHRELVSIRGDVAAVDADTKKIVQRGDCGTRPTPDEVLVHYCRGILQFGLNLQGSEVR
jgi:hypothetical protein